MILVDTSIWIDHLHRGDADLVGLLEASEVMTHPMIIGELALGSLRDRVQVLSLLLALPSAPTVTHHELMSFVKAQGLAGIGLSLVDAHLLAATRLRDDAQLWTRDRRLNGAAARLGLALPR